MSNTNVPSNGPRSVAGAKCVCCTDLLKRNKTHNIFDEYGKFRQIQFLLSECVQKTIVEVPGSRQAICSDCLNQLEQNYAFKLKCTSQKTEDNSDDAEDVEDADDAEDVKDADDAVAEASDGLAHVHEGDGDILIDYEDEHAAVSEAVITYDPECPIIVKVEPEHLSSSNVIVVTEPCSSPNRTEYYDDEQLNDGVDLNVDCRLIVESELESVQVADVIEYEPCDQLEMKPEDDDVVDDATMSESVEKPEVFMATTSFVDSLTVHSIKEIIRAGIPVHSVGSSHVQDEDDPLDNRVENEEEHPIDVDEYVMSIVSVSFCEFSPLYGRPKCVLCETCVDLTNYTTLMQHVVQEHIVDDQYNCCLPGCGVTCSDQDILNNHMFVNHSDVLKVRCFLTCQTCDLVTESLVKFGKHVCTGPIKPSTKTEAEAVAVPAVDNACGQCQLQLRSHRRHTFHQQFHCTNARPKICLICERLFANEHRFYEHVQFAHDQFAQHFCRHCDKSFTLAAELGRHEHAHTAVRTHHCPDCGKAFFDTATLSAHSALHQVGYTCDLCSKRFNRKFRLRKHMALHVTHEPAVLPVCERCGRIFVTEAAAHEHWTAEHEGYDDEADPSNVVATACDDTPLVANVFVEHAFCCEYCEAAYDQVSLLLAHKATHEETELHISSDGEAASLKFQCAHCPRRFAQYARLRSHSSAHPESQRPFPVKRMYVCELDDCRKPYADWNNYQSHRKTVHLVNPSIIRCTECDEVFYKSWLYAYHKKSVHQAHKQCPLCPQTFVVKRALDEHVARVHVDQPEADEPRTDAKKSSVGVVKRATRTRRAGDATTGTLVQEDLHYSANANGDGFRCLDCGKVSVRRSNAVSHVRMVHMKIRNFSCAECSRTFYHRGDFNDHMKMHNAITPFQCPYCEHQVRTSSMLKVHIRSHTNERPYQCLQCPKAFKRAMVLKNHMKLHTGVKEFSCDDCAKTFYTKYSLATHLRKKNCNAKETIAVSRVPLKKIRKKTTPSIIIVMPGPPDKNIRQNGAETERKSQNVIILS